MVSTRRGGRVNSPSKTNQEETPVTQATPSTCRRTRSTSKQVDPRTQQTLEDPHSQLETIEAGLLVTPVVFTRKRCTRSSRLHSPEQSSTPVGSVHEADVSDVESVCSAVSNTGPVVTRSTGRRMQTRTRNQESEISEVESCSSVSASKPCRRSTRRKTTSFSSDSVQHEGEEVKADPVQEGKSCSSAVSENQRITRSQRKTARTRSSAKHQTEDSEFSDADSCTSSISGRVSRRQMHPILIHLDELPESSQSPRASRRIRAARGKVAASGDVSEPLSCDSEGFESGPSYSLSTRRSSRAQSARRKAVDSDSEAPVSSPCSTRSRGTPCSSRAGSGTRSRGAPVSRHSEMKHDVENSGESAEEDSSVNDSRLESTVIANDAERTLLEDDESQTPEACVRNIDLDSSETENKHAANISEDNCHVASPSSVCMEETVSELAVITKDQKEEPSAEKQDEDESEMEMMQELVPPSEQPQACQTDTATCEGVSEMTEEPHLVEEEDKISSDARQVVDTSEVQTEAAPSNQQDTEDSESEPQPKDAQCRKAITLLDSSEEEEDDDDEEEVVCEVSEEERRGEPSSRSEAASSSVDGLFVIDTRPGLDADEQYYREEEEASNKRTEQEEEDEEFVDEEGDDDDDDEDTKILLSSRNSHMKELSSRIDPGIRVKELGGLYISFDGSKSKPVSSSLQKQKEKKNHDEVMKKSVIGPDFEKKDAVPPYSESKQALKLKRRAEREKSTGDGWFNMKAPEITQELKGDLQVLKMRGSLDPKRFYKKNDRDGFPKYFQIGTVVDTPADFYHSRIPKKQRKRTMVEELLADAEFRHKNKKKYQQIIAEKTAQGAGKRRKKNKFHRK